MKKVTIGDQIQLTHDVMSNFARDLIDVCNKHGMELEVDDHSIRVLKRLEETGRFVSLGSFGNIELGSEPDDVINYIFGEERLDHP